ncbi:hypothetical protein T4B_5436 [Trichinella pseudospiralis]|uniref:Uncharacterized protein n=2 Tax=Trichinella pseudospiralis TaxID=6337 RepID=A0A0V1IMD1_TRIPS|nr:hypothetical protein T4E_8000 [Trichinella pseudospiralis]KRY69929.1 hypothetical protein T4A_493 [Trichinella pseudospiralis]KRY83621.1 hypothetical protein T4D_9956 [Trichinella pseudospiralis]KRZ23934.1 hypothetical protein T4B_5436 [Trichinella pseudospiralis]KRZ36190.1 hypothetical protein T4C_4807 [Trichinella pseudospiralis]
MCRIKRLAFKRPLQSFSSIIIIIIITAGRRRHKCHRRQSSLIEWPIVASGRCPLTSDRVKAPRPGLGGVSTLSSFGRRNFHLGIFHFPYFSSATDKNRFPPICCPKCKRNQPITKDNMQNR